MNCVQCGGSDYFCKCCMWSKLPQHKEELTKRLKEYTQLLDKIYTTRKEVGNEN